jgi:hypothetical protein
MQNANSKSHKGDFAKPKIRNCQVTKASFAKQMLEGDGDAFWFKLQSHTKVTHQTKKLRTVSLPKLAQSNQCKRATSTFSQWQWHKF